MEMRPTRCGPKADEPVPEGVTVVAECCSPLAAHFRIIRDDAIRQYSVLPEGNGI
jgi:hypothetical protein